MINEIDCKKTFEIITKSKQITLTTHQSPDGDAIGSVLAIYNFLTLYYPTINVKVINLDPTPNYLQFLKKSEDIISYTGIINDIKLKSDNDNFILNSDLIIIADLNTLKRVGDLSIPISNSNAQKLVIDHHLEPADFANYYCIDFNATSTCEIIYKIIIEGKAIFDKSIAEALYTGIMTDTGGFRFDRTSPETHLITSKLLEYGVVPYIIHNHIFASSEKNIMKLLGNALYNMQFYFDDRLCIMKITKEMFEETGVGINELEGFVHHTLNINGVEIGVLATDNYGANEIRFSIRSKGKYSVREVAAKFGGGGHAFAAGVRFKNYKMDEAIELIKKEIGEVLRG